jgi:hypothetical protein
LVVVPSMSCKLSSSFFEVEVFLFLYLCLKQGGLSHKEQMGQSPHIACIEKDFTTWLQPLSCCLVPLSIPPGKKSPQRDPIQQACFCHPYSPCSQYCSQNPSYHRKLQRYTQNKTNNKSVYSRSTPVVSTLTYLVYPPI